MLVSVITPSRNREAFLNRTLSYFQDQSYVNKEWLILDDSARPCVSLRGLGSNVHYQHSDHKISVGEKRNRLIAQAQGDIIVHFDDDDYYAPDYITCMAGAIDELQADLLNLRGWFVYAVKSQFFGYVDTMLKGSSHFAFDQGELRWGRFNPPDNEDHLGYGFSFVYRRAVCEVVKFPDVDWNEDGVFSSDVRAQYFKMNGLHDMTGLCLHILHPSSSSRCYPQYHLPDFSLKQLFPGYHP